MSNAEQKTLRVYPSTYSIYGQTALSWVIMLFAFWFNEKVLDGVVPGWFIGCLLFLILISVAVRIGDKFVSTNEEDAIAKVKEFYAK